MEVLASCESKEIKPNSKRKRGICLPDQSQVNLRSILILFFFVCFIVVR